MTSEPEKKADIKSETEQAPQFEVPKQTRAERIIDLDQELKSYEGPRSTKELDKRIEAIRQQYSSAAEGISMSRETDTLLQSKMGKEIAGIKDQRNKFQESRHEVNHLRAEDLISYLEFFGAEMSDESRKKAIEILASPQIIHIDRKKLAELLEIKTDDKFAQRISKSREFFYKYSKLLKDPLMEENQEIFLDADIKLAGHKDVQIDDEIVDTANLSDPEVANLGGKEIKQTVVGILSDKNCNADQGMFWNVLVPEKIPYVLKTPRKQADSGTERYSRDALLRYPIIRDCIGKEFLPKQAVLQVAGSEQMYILQEKMPLSDMTSIRTNNIDAFLDGKYGQEVAEALKEDKNKEKLKAFIEGVERLYSEHKLMIDVLGENLFFKVSENGELDIKLVDYGAFKQWGEKQDDNTERSVKFINKLKKAYL